MSKKKKIKTTTPVAPAPTRKTAVSPYRDPQQNTRIFLLLVLIISCIVLYANTASHEYALDDAMMITQNEITLKGFAGIGEHLRHSFLYGFMHQEGFDAASSHWRPLTMISYAIDVGIWGPDKPGKSHLVNLIIYTGLVLLLFNLLRKYIFRDLWLGFIAAFLFAIHPIHTEVVANIKGRDELICLFFLLWSLHQLWRFIEKKKTIAYISALLLFGLSMTAKENSLVFLAGIPIMLYFFTDLTFKKIAVYTGGFLAVTILLVVIRNAIVPLSNVAMSNEVTNNPYLYAKGAESLATKFYVLSLFVKMLVWPHPLVYDYSYRHIPYVGFDDMRVWLSVALYLALAAIALLGIRSKQIISYAIIMFFICISINSNILVNTGVMMAERMLFTASIFGMIAITAASHKLGIFAHEKWNFKKPVFAALLLVPVTALCFFKTIDRNKDWKNDTTLNLADIKNVPNSTRVNGGAGTACLTLADDPQRTKPEKDSLIRQAIRYYRRAVEIHPAYNDPWMNMGVAYSRLDSIFKAEECWNDVRKRNPNLGKLKELDRYMVSVFMNRGVIAEQQRKLDSAIFFYQKVENYAQGTDTMRLNGLYQLAGTYYNKGDYLNAKQTLEKLMAISPNYKDAQKGYQATVHFLGQQPK